MRLVADERERLDRFLVRNVAGTSRSQIGRWIQRGLVRVDGDACTKAGRELRPGEAVELAEDRSPAPMDLEPFDLALEVVHEEPSFLVVNKPRGLATHPAPSLREPTLVNALLARYGRLSGAGEAFRPGIVHRLDKDTTGLLVVARSDEAHRCLAKQIAEKAAERRYFCLVVGRLSETVFTIDAPVGRHPTDRLRMAVTERGKSAVTHCKVIRPLDEVSVLGVRLETGRTHQIRVHLSAVGLPVVGDALYGKTERMTEGLQLHAGYLGFRHPENGREMRFFARPPEDFLADNLEQDDLEIWTK